MKPDFSQIDYKPQPAAAAPQTEGVDSPVRNTLERIPLKAFYTADDLYAMEHLDYAAGVPAVPARSLRHHVRDAAVDYPAVRRLLHRRRVQRLLPAQSRGRPEGP